MDNQGVDFWRKTMNLKQNIKTQVHTHVHVYTHAHTHAHTHTHTHTSTHIHTQTHTNTTTQYQSLFGSCTSSPHSLAADQLRHSEWTSVPSQICEGDHQVCRRLETPKRWTTQCQQYLQQCNSTVGVHYKLTILVRGDTQFDSIRQLFREIYSSSKLKGNSDNSF